MAEFTRQCNQEVQCVREEGEESDLEQCYEVGEVGGGVWWGESVHP